MEHTLHLATSHGQRPAASLDTLVRLPANATIAGRLAAGACIAVQSGRVWLTQAGDANDYFIAAGQRHVLARAGLVVIEGDLASTTLRVLADSAALARPGFP
jgi:hypothetical protein